MEQYRDTNPLILGMPRGGVVVAFEVAKALNASLDVIVVRKIGAPGQPELAIGAIAPGDTVVLNDELVQMFGLSDTELNLLIAQEKKELARRIRVYRSGVEFPAIRGRTVIMVDDGLATGQTAIAAARAVRALKPKQLILAVGVCAADSKKLLQKEVDKIVCVSTPALFYAVGQAYSQFEQTTDEEVISLLAKSRDRK